MSAPARGLHQRLLDQPLDGGVVVDAAALDQQAVVAVVGEGVERDVAHDARPPGTASFIALHGGGRSGRPDRAPAEPIASFFVAVDVGEDGDASGCRGRAPAWRP